MRKYWRGIAIAGVVAVISGCGAASGSKNSINNGYIMETAAAAMDVENEKGEMSGEGASAFGATAAGTASTKADVRGRGISFCGYSSGHSIRNREYGNSRNRPKADQNCQHGR